MADRNSHDALTEEPRTRRSVAITLLIVVLVALAYSIVLFFAGNALQNAPFARQILQARERLRELTVFEPPENLPPPVLEAGPGAIASPSPIIASPRPEPSLSPSFVPPAPDDPALITFTIEYENTTGVRLTGVVINDRIPAGTTYRAGSSIPGASFDGTSLVWNIGTLDPGAKGTVKFQVFTNRTGRITNRAVLTSNEAPPAEIESSANVS